MNQLIRPPSARHPVVSREEWIEARKAHLKNEKALTRMRDMLSAERRALPWVKVEKNYVFDTADGKKTLAELFGGNSQLIVHHFMWRQDLDQGCAELLAPRPITPRARSASGNHDVSYVRVSRAPLDKFQAYRKRLGWKRRMGVVLRTATSTSTITSRSPRADDEGSSTTITNHRPRTASNELPGLSVFFKDEAGEVFHTYSSYARGNEEVIGAFIYLDMTPKGRNEKEIMDWVKRHDEYDQQPGKAASCCA